MKQLLTILFRYLLAIVPQPQIIALAQKALSLVEIFKKILVMDSDVEQKLLLIQEQLSPEFPTFFRNTFGLELKTYLGEKQTSTFKKHSDWYYLEMAATMIRSEYPNIGATESYIIMLLCYNQFKVENPKKS